MEIFVLCRVNEEAKEESRRKFVKFPLLPTMDQNFCVFNPSQYLLCLFGNRFVEISLSFSCALI